MGRLHHLSYTLPANIINTGSYPNREFIILNYGSKDGLDEWAYKNLMPWIKKGIVKYYKTELPEYFNAAHAKNIAHRQATGDIVCNLDADNFLLDGFAELLVSLHKKSKCVVASPSVDAFGTAGSCGKISVLTEHFYSVNGYDEDWYVGWGWDDVNFRYRVRMQNNLEYYEVHPKWCRTIEHSNEDRAMNFRNQNILETEKLSIERIKEIKESKKYVANQCREWGKAIDLSCNFDK